MLLLPLQTTTAMPSWFTLLYLFFNALFANGDQSRYPLTVLSDCEDLNQFGWKCQLDPAIDPTILHLQPSRMFGHPNQFYLDVDLLRRPPIEMTFMAIHVKRRFLDVQISGLEEADMQRLKRGNLKVCKDLDHTLLTLDFCPILAI